MPLALSGSTLAVWLTERGVDLGTIGLFSLVGLPYTFKFLWAPLVDALDVPLLSRALGRRRGWLVFTQICCWSPRSCCSAFAIRHNRCRSSSSARCWSATASATQDIVIDAFRVESLEPSEQAAGMAGYVAAYRIGMLVSGAGRTGAGGLAGSVGRSHATPYGCGAIIAAALA